MQLQVAKDKIIKPGNLQLWFQGNEFRFVNRLKCQKVTVTYLFLSAFTIQVC